MEEQNIGKNDFADVVEKAAGIISKGGIIAYPTDTVWGIGCDATNAEAVERIYQLKKRPGHKAMICLVNSTPMLERLTGPLPTAALDLIENPLKPTTVVYPRVRGVAANLLAADGSLAIRLVKNRFCEELIAAIDTPLVSTSANISGEPTPSGFGEISDAILKGVDYIVPLKSSAPKGQPSAIVKLEKDNSITVIRN